jgi:hypothetical protein
MTQLASEEQHVFIFLSDSGGSTGVYVTLAHLEVLTEFNLACRIAVTWKEFCDSLSPYTLDFIEPFIGADGEDWPDDGDLISDLKETMWLFYDGDFPFLQCHQECWGLYRSLFPDVPGLETDLTEYGEEVAYFPGESYPLVSQSLREKGHLVSRSVAP